MRQGVRYEGNLRPLIAGLSTVDPTVGTESPLGSNRAVTARPKP